MLTILHLFGRSPFAPLQAHMQKVSACIKKVEEMFQALSQGDQSRLQKLSEEVSDLEHAADLTKNEIRSHLPNSLFLPIDRSNLLEILSLQDHIADTAEDIGVLLTLRPLSFPEELRAPFLAFLKKNLQTYELVQKIIEEWKDLLESTFGGVEAQKVRQMVEEVSLEEHEADLLQRDLLRVLYNMEPLNEREFHLWMRVCEKLGAIADLCEKLANRVRLTLDLK